MVIIQGVVGSILASILIGAFLILFEPNSKEKYSARVSMMQHYVWIIDNKYSFEKDYSEVMHSAEEIVRLIREIGDHVKYFNRFRKERKLFFTVLYDLEHRCEYMCLQTVGYDNDTEIKQRIKRIKKVICDEDEYEELVLDKEVGWLQELLNGNIPPISENVLDINSFRTPNDERFIRRFGVSMEEFQESYCIIDIVKMF